MPEATIIRLSAEHFSAISQALWSSLTHLTWLLSIVIWSFVSHCYCLATAGSWYLVHSVLRWQAIGFRSWVRDPAWVAMIMLSACLIMHEAQLPFTVKISSDLPWGSSCRCVTVWSLCCTLWEFTSKAGGSCLTYGWTNASQLYCPVVLINTVAQWLFTKRTPDPSHLNGDLN